MTLQEFMAANGLRQKFDEDGQPSGWVDATTGRGVDNEDFNKSGKLIETYNKLAASNFDYGALADQSGYSGSDPAAYFRGQQDANGSDVGFGNYTLNNLMQATNQDSQFYGADKLLKDYAFGGGFDDSNPSASYQNFVSGQAPDRTDWIGPLLQAAMISGVGGLAFGGIGGGAGELASGFTDAASGAIGAGDLGTTIGAEGLGGFDFGGAGFGELGSGSFGAAENLANSTSILSNTGGALGSGLAGTAGAGSPLLGETGFGIAGADSSWGANPLARLLNLGKTGSDALAVGGNLLGAGLGAYGANQQANSYGDIANKFMDMGAPYRGLLEQSYQPGFSMANQPDFMNALDIGSQAAARATSAKAGNPVGNPGAYADMQKYISGSLALPQLNTYRSQLGTFGQLGTSQAGQAMGNQTQAQGGVYDALGYGIGQATQPDNPFKGLLDQLKGFKLNNGGSFV